MEAAKSVTPDAISTLLSIPKPDSLTDLPQIIIQVTKLEPKGKSYVFDAVDGKRKIKAIFSSRLSSEIISGNIQNLGLIQVLDYTVNEIPTKSEKYLIITKCEVVPPSLGMEIKGELASPSIGMEVKDEISHVKSGTGIILKKPKLENEVKSEVKRELDDIILKPKHAIVAKSAAQIVHEQRGNMAPAARMAMTRRVHPLVSLNPYQGNWTIKVRVTSKGNMRTYRNARGEGCVFNVELTDEDGTQIHATMFNESAKKFYDKFELGKVYYISKGTLRVANKQFKTVQNDYEMTLNENSEVEEASNETTCIPETKIKFVPFDQLGPYVNSKELVDVIGIVQGVLPTMSIRRKSNNEMVPKRDIVIADETKKTVVVSLWNELAENVGQELLDIADKSPIVAIKSLKVGDFQGISLSTVGRSIVQVNPDIVESKRLRNWYDSEGKETTMASVGSGLTPSTKTGARSMYSDRVSLSHIISNPSLGEGKKMRFTYQMKLKEATWSPHLLRVSVGQNEYNNEKRQRVTVRAVAPLDFAAESRFLLEEISKMKGFQ